VIASRLQHSCSWSTSSICWPSNDEQTDSNSDASLREYGRRKKGQTGRFLKLSMSGGVTIGLLAAPARAMLAFPATSASTERLFSCASFIQSKRRANLSFDHLESVVSIRQNWKLGDCHELVRNAIALRNAPPVVDISDQSDDED
jgi:hAT family C-terminal dimerisation region